MKYGQKILDDVFLDALHGFTIVQIAERIGIEPKEFIADFNDEETQLRFYYESGRAKGRVETDSIQYELAKNGSSSAKKAYDERLIDAELSNKFREILNS